MGTGGTFGAECVSPGSSRIRNRCIRHTGDPGDNGQVKGYKFKTGTLGRAKPGHFMEKLPFTNAKCGNPLAVQRLGLGAFTAVSPGLIPGWGTKIPKAAQRSQKKKKKKYKCKVFWL